MPRRIKVFRDGSVYICSRLCDTCIFRPGGIDLAPGRVEGMVAACLREDTIIPCHEIMNTKTPAICRGFYERHKRDIMPLRLAQHFGNIVERKV